LGVGLVDDHRGSGMPDAARAWVNEAIGPDELVVASSDMRGATSSAVYEVATSTRRGLRRRLVLRWYPDDAFFVSEPSAVEREAAALELMAGTGVPAPRLVGRLDRQGEGPAAILMTHLPGRPVFDRLDPIAIREVLDAVHAVDPRPMARFRYRGYHETAELDRPSWWQDRPAWDRAVDRTSTARPTGPDRLVHRDFHPGNLLWSDGRLAGVVDWVNACVGPADVDAAHCRVNLALLWGPERADEIVPGDPAWDIELALGMLDWEDGANDAWPGAIPSALAAMGAPLVDVGTVRRRLEAFVRRALASLG
jgi:aminoglycoside phosphotransferase (APT) family kinase protein